jgi:hypothetical protein
MERAAGTTVVPMQPWSTADGERAIYALSWHLRSATLVGNPAPVVAEIYDRMRHPQVDDLVVESTRGHYDAHAERGDWYRGIGILIAVQREWLSTDDEWAADPDSAFDDNRASDEWTYVQYGPAPEDVCRWGNCEFMMVPWSRDQLGRS